MNQNLNKLIAICLVSIGLIQFSFGQNRNFHVNLALGVGLSGFEIEDTGTDELKRLFYPMTGLQFQKRINPKWAINIFPNVGMSGMTRTLSDPIANNITQVKTKSAFINLAIHSKYYINDNFYFCFGPEIGYLIWNYGSAFSDDRRLYNRKETDNFNRVNLLLSSSLGFSKKIEESRKDAPVQIDVLLFLELRFKKGITNIINNDLIEQDFSTSINSIELVTGFSFGSKK